MRKNIHDEIEFLNYIYKNAEMGIIGIDNVIKKVEDEKFEKMLLKERKEYESITKEVKDLLRKYGLKSEEISLMSKISTTIMTEMELMKDNSINVIAKMMMEGTNKGIIEIVEKLNAYNNIDAKTIVLANRLKSILESNIEELKKYL